jgi:hypothetical protein
VTFLSVLALILLLWGVITLVRRIAESEEQRRARGGMGTWRAAAGDDWDATPPPREREHEDLRTDAWTHEERRTDAPTHREPHSSDAIDYEELERAEDEVRDLGADARPEDGFEGDDWGPGAPRKPPLY